MRTPTASRRAILRAGLTTAAATLASTWPAAHAKAQDDGPTDPGGRVRMDCDETTSFNELYGHPPLLGRVEGWTLRVLKDPARYNDVLRYAHYDEVLPIYGVLHADPPYPYGHNDIWFDIGEGYIHSSYVVPVKEQFNKPQRVTGDGFWGEITVPTSWQHWQPALNSTRYYDLAYGTLHRVVERADEPDGRAWYRLLDDLNPRAAWWVQARHVRRIEPKEFEPISLEVPPRDKRVEVSIDRQILTCYEYKRPVFSVRIASGTAFVDAEGKVHHFNTPYGEHWVRLKRPSRHMAGGQDINDFFDLPGVPWVTFFTLKGAAIHGTYWHNDFGRPRSHGCINVTSDAAKWIYRWVNPYQGHDAEYLWTPDTERSSATRVIVEH